MLGKNRPVMFRNHGGGWQAGGTADVNFGGGPGRAGDPAAKELLAFVERVVQP